MTRVQAIVLLLFIWICFTSPLQAFEEVTGPTDPPLLLQYRKIAPQVFTWASRAFLSAGMPGWIFRRAGSDLFSMVTQQLTLEKSDFRSPAVGFDFGVPFQSRFGSWFHGNMRGFHQIRNPVLSWTPTDCL